MVNPRLPLYVTVRGAANALGVVPKTIRLWLRDGTLRGVMSQLPEQERHYLDTTVRRTTRGRWLIELVSLQDCLTRLYSGQPVPPALLRKLRKLANPQG